MVQFCLDAALYLQRMGQYREVEGEEKEPAIVVHCKAGKGRTGMMISALMFFISMFNSPEDSINHYNNTRVRDMKGLTISSQKRYVKFM